MAEYIVGQRTPAGYLAGAEPGPGVLVLHAWWGLTPFFQQVCDRLVEAGFVALAPDLYHGETAATIEEAERLLDVVAGESNIPTLVQDLMGALAALQALPQVQGTRRGALGFSMGAYWSLRLATEDPETFGAVVVFYGTGENLDQVQAAIQGHFAADDPYEDADAPAQLAALDRPDRPVEAYTYPDSGHWFFEADRPAYQAEAAALAWERTVAFLHTHLDAANAPG